MAWEINNYIPKRGRPVNNKKVLPPRIQEIKAVSLVQEQIINEIETEKQVTNEGVFLFKEYLLTHLKKDLKLYKAQKEKAKKQLLKRGKGVQDFLACDISIKVTKDFIAFIEKTERG